MHKYNFSVLALTRLMIFTLLIIADILIVVIEIPQLDFPKTSVFFSDIPINYWLDIFFPIIDAPARIFSTLLVLSVLILFFTCWISKRWNFLWVLGIVTISFIDIVLLWISIIWVHNMLICRVEELKNEDLFGCFYLNGLEPWHITVGIIFSIPIIVLGITLGKRLMKKKV